MGGPNVAFELAEKRSSEQLPLSHPADPKKGLPSTVQLLQRIWPIVAFTGMINVFNMLEANIYLPYLYSRVRCCDSAEGRLDSRYDIREPREVAKLQDAAAGLGLDVPRKSEIPACDLPHFPPGHTLWSMSPGCANKAYVQDSAQGVVAVSTPLQKLATLAILPVGSAVADAQGRRPVLAAYAGCCLLACLLFAADSLAPCSVMPLYLGMVLLCVSWEPKDAAVSGAIADLVEEQSRPRAFAAVAALNSVGGVSGFAVAFLCVRLHLGCFAVPWLGFAAVAGAMLALIAVALPETLPQRLQRPLTLSMLGSWRLLAQDRVLVLLAVSYFLWCVHFVGFITTAFSYLTMMGFSMEEAVATGAVGNVAQVALAAAMVPLLPRMGVWSAFIAGHSCFLLAYVLWGPFTQLVDGRLGPYLANFAQAGGFAMTFPPAQAIISQRVGEADQSKCQGAVSAVGVLGAMFGTMVYSGLIFDGTARGFTRAVPALWSAALAAVCVGLAVAMTLLAREREPEQAPEGL